MAHNLNYNERTGKYSFFSVQQKAWHNLGQIIEQYPTSAEAIKYAGLDFEVQAEIVPEQDIDGLFQRWNFNSRKTIPEPASGFEIGDVRIIRLRDEAGAVGGTFQFFVVEDDRHVVTRKLDVEFDPFHAEARRRCDAFEGVFGGVSLGAAMADDFGDFEGHGTVNRYCS